MSGAIPQHADRITTGIAGLDDVLHGGFPRHRLYLIQGDPGSGKTTLGLQFLLEGLRRREAGLYVTLSETAGELKAVADSHGWSLDGLALHELSQVEDSLLQDAANTFFKPSEVELSETMTPVLKLVEESRPVRVVFDSLSELRLLAGEPLRYRRQLLALKQFFVGRHCTVLLLDDRTSEVNDLQLQSLAHGVVLLEQLTPEYGAQRRRLRVVKLRGSRFRGGHHDYTIETGGLAVYPRLVAAEHRQVTGRGTLSSGLEALDTLLGGGLDRGTSTLLMGPAGSGKSVLATQYASAAAARGEKAAIFLFEEGRDTLLARAAGLGLDVQKHVDSGAIALRQLDPAEVSPGEFAGLVRRYVEVDHATVIVIDSLNGYLNAMPGERFLIIHMHELLAYLAERGVVTLLVLAQHGLLGQGVNTPVDFSYLADTLILLRYFESKGAVRQAISIVKKRSGAHERTIREFHLGADGIRVGGPLVEFQGILSGTPEYQGKAATLMKDAHDQPKR